MALAKITAGLLIPSIEGLEHARILSEATGLISVEIESDQYCAKPSDQSARQFIHAKPEIILVDIEDTQAGILSIEILHGALPETHLLAISKKADPKLIIQAVRAGAREFLQGPIQPHSISQAIDRYVAEKRRKLETRKEGKIYCFMAGKEGSGVTSIAINVASAFASMPETRVALMDLDSPVGDAAIYLNLATQHKIIEDVLAAGSRLDSLLLESCMSQADGFFLLPAPKEWGKQKLPGPETIAKLLKVAAQTYTHTIVDLPHSMPLEQLQAVANAAEFLIVVLNPDLSSISRTGLLLRHLAFCEVPDKIRLVVNRSHDLDEIDSKLMEKALHFPIYYKIPNNYKDSVRSMMSGKPLARNNKSELAQSYHRLARLLAGIPEPKGRHRVANASQQPGLWNNIVAAFFPFLRKSSRIQRPAIGHRHRREAAATRVRMNLLN
jgi:pilus assembly protein CpaE